MVKLSGFSRESGYLHYYHFPKEAVYFQVSAQKVDLPAFLNAYILQRGHPSPRGSVTAPSPQIAHYGSHGILTVSAIALAVRLMLRTRLTPG